MYNNAQNAIRNTLWNFMGSIMEATGIDNENKKEAVTAIMSEELCKFCKVDDTSIDIQAAKPMLKATTWILNAKLAEAKQSNDKDAIRELTSLIASFNVYINNL